MQRFKSHSLAFLHVCASHVSLCPSSQLRADIESCVAGSFKGVGVANNGAGGKILQHVDDGITRMLMDHMKGEGMNI